MESDLVRPGRHLALKALIAKAIILLLISAVAQNINGFEGALAVFTGGGIAIIADSIFTFFAFRFSGASKNIEVVQSFKKGNKAKLLVTAMLLFIVFQRPEFQRTELLVGYVVILLAHFPVMIFLHQWRKRG